ncbi:hypothetical protein HanRHA438_Chr16g0787661 [Helianthus annuus]|nr:hypothetical protein HanRHA438_Chr16g0787661 [Helianthus annuus]
MNAVMMTKQKAINFYIEESAKWKQELETEKIENERIRRLLQSYSSSDYLSLIEFIRLLQVLKLSKMTGQRRRILVRNRLLAITSVCLRSGKGILPGNQTRSNSKKQSI